MRKILKNNRKSKRMCGYKEGKIGAILNLLDKNDTILCVGDEVKYGDYRGIILYSNTHKDYGVAISDSMWYGDNKYDINSYGKFVSIPKDNGAKMLLEKINL